MRALFIVLAAVTTLVVGGYALIQQRNAQYSKDGETGEPCPGFALTYECEITEGSYLEFRVGMTSEEVFEVICRGSSIPRFRYAGIDAQGVPEEVRRQRPAVYYVPTQTFSPSADEIEGFCRLSEFTPYAVRYFVRRDRAWPFGDLLSLEIEAGRLHSIHIGTGTLDL